LISFMSFHRQPTRCGMVALRRFGHGCSCCFCYDAGFASYEIFVDVFSIAALYSPRRAAQLHLAR
jgi:hypothetical protein